jgi:hypothetical protein
MNPPIPGFTPLMIDNPSAEMGYLLVIEKHMGYAVFFKTLAEYSSDTGSDNVRPPP